MASVEQHKTTDLTTDEVVNAVRDEGARLGVRRFFTIPGRDPFDEIEWEIARRARSPASNGPAFEQKGVEFPKFWSQTATNIVAQKYFRGRLGSPERESQRQADDRPRRRHDRRVGPRRAATSPTTRRPRPSRPS